MSAITIAVPCAAPALHDAVAGCSSEAQKGEGYKQVTRLQVEGVFRIPGDVQRMAEMRGFFNEDFSWQFPADEPVPNVASTIIFFLLEHRNKDGKKEYMWGKQARRDVFYITKLPKDEWVDRGVEILLSLSPACQETLWVIIECLRHVALPENAAVNRFGNPDIDEATRKVALCVFPDIMTLAELMMTHYDEMHARTH